MKIVRWEAKNFMGVSCVEIDTHGKSVVMGGDNGQGKTSAILAIGATLAGAKAIPERPIKDGEEEASTLVELGEIGSDIGFIIKRKYKASGKTSLVVESKDGARYQSAQTMIAEFFSALSFNPAEFKNMTPAQQAETLRKLDPALDFTAHDVKRKGVYAMRTDAARDLKRAEAKLHGMPRPDAPEAEISIAVAVRELERRRGVNLSNAAKRAELIAVRSEVHDLTDALTGARVRQQAAIASCKAEIEEAEAKLNQAIIEQSDKVADAERAISDAKVKGRAIKTEIGTLEDEDVAGAQGVIDTAEETNRLVREAAAHDTQKAEVKTLRGDHKKLDDEIAALDKAKKKAISEADFPVDGLAISDSSVSLHGIPFRQASTSQQAEACVEIGMALNPRAKFMTVHRGECMDDKSLQALLDAADAKGVQLIVDVVGVRDATTVVMEDGMVLHSK